MESSISSQALMATIPIYVMIFSGWLCRKLGWVKPENDSALMRIAIDLALPCFILYNMLGNKLLHSITYSLTAIGLGVMGVVLCLMVTWGISRLLRLKVGEGQRTFVLAAGFHNYGFFIIPLVAILYPQPGNPMMGLVLAHNVGCDLIVWSVGILMIADQMKFSYKLFLRGPVLVVFLALFLIWTGLDQFIPTVAKTSLQMIGNSAIPLNLFIFGNLLYDLLGKEKFSPRLVCIGVVTRMGILPLMFLGLAVALPVAMPLKELLVFQAIAPSAVTSAVIARHFGGHPGVAVQITMATMLVSFVTLPFWINLGFSWIGR